MIFYKNEHQLLKNAGLKLLLMAERFESEYMPIEFFLAEFSDYNLVSWIIDQIGCLRAVFKVYETEKSNIKDVVYVGDARIQLIRTEKDAFSIVSNDSLNDAIFDNTTCLHLKDGTIVLFSVSQENGKLIGYHICFEESPAASS